MNPFCASKRFVLAVRKATALELCKSLAWTLAALFIALPARGDPGEVSINGTADPRAEARSVEPAKPLPTIPSIQTGVVVPALKAVELGPVDTAALLAEDARLNVENKCLRYGIGRDISVTMDNGQWLPCPGGGRLWVAEVVSQGALGLRLHFANMSLAPGGQVFVYSPSDPQHTAGPYEDRGILNDGQFWTPTRWGERMRIEYYEPPQKPGFALPAAPFSIDRLQHIYLDPSIPVREGSCYYDVTCYSGYTSLSYAVGGIGVVNNNSLYCSGQLLNSQNGDLTPYYLTANHCLSTNATAQSSEIYWLFQTSSCNGSPPAINTVPQSAVCTLLSTSSNSDYTLLMVNGALPNGLYWSGWTSGAPTDGTAVAGIHHPGGAYKRISFGNKASNLTCGNANHIRSNWYLAGGASQISVTEPGSSGSGLFRQDNQQLVGQLHCGPSACGNADADQHDDYGAFSVTYGNISTFLSGGNDDAFEPNDTCATASAVGPGSFPGLIVKSTHEDWYQFSIPGGGGTTSINVSFTDAYGDIDIQLWNGCGGSVVASSTGTSNTETINYTNNGGTQNFYLHVYLYSGTGGGTRNTYSLNLAVNGPVPANDNCASATVIGNGTFTGDTSGGSNDGSASCGTSNASKDVWFKYIATCSGTLNVDTCGSSYDTVLSVHSGCPGTAGNELACDDDCPGGAGFSCNGSTRSCLSLGVSVGTTYLIRVSGFNGASGAFVLHTAIVAAAPANNACASAIAVSPGSYSGTTCGATTDGSSNCGFSNASPDVWYSYTAPCTGTLLLDTCGSNYDTVLSVHSACPGTSGNEIACDDDCASGGCVGALQSCLSVPVTLGTTYYIRVSGYSGASGNYILNVAGAIPANDDCGSAIEIGNGTYTGATCFATNDGQSSCGTSNLSKDVWYTYTPVCSGTLKLDLCGSSYDTAISVHTGCPGTAANEIACNDDCVTTGVACNGALQSCLSEPVTGGVAYLIRVTGFNGNAGNFTLNVSLATPANDLCTSATPIGNGNFAFSNCGATTDGPDEPGSCNFAGYTQIGNDIWYRYTATCNGVVTANVCNSNFDTKMAVYQTMCPGGGGPLLACNDDYCGLQSRVTFSAINGGQYLIRIGGYFGAQGNGVLEIYCCGAAPDGDANLSGTTNGLDIQAFVNAMLANPYDPVILCHCDFDGSGVIDVGDIAGMVAKLLS